MHYQSTQNLAKELYVKGDKTQIEIAEQVGVHHKTIAYWVKQKKWNELKTQVRHAPAFISLSLLAQLQDFQGVIMERGEGNRGPTMEEVLIQSKLMAALFRFPLPKTDDLDDLVQTYVVRNDAAKTPEDKKPAQIIDGQGGEENQKDKNAPALTTQTIQPNTSLRKNVILRSGARWIEKGVIYDPLLKRNRTLTKSEYDELIRKGLTKADFQGWSPGLNV